jgi:hypothetical protein
MRITLILIALAGLLAACQPPPLEWTKGQVHFAKSRDDFYRKKWHTSLSARQARVCAGFVHRRNFGHYLKFGQFKLVMILQVYKDGTPVMKEGRVAGWDGGKLLRTMKRSIRVGERHNRYVWCGRLRKGGTWKNGAMRFSFGLAGPERAMGEKLAAGVLQIIP